MNRTATKSGPPRVPVHPAVKAATPRWMVWAAAGLSWVQAVATAVVFVLIGVVLDSPGLDGGLVAWASALTVTAAALAGIGIWFAQWAGARTERALRRDVVRGTYALGVTNPQSGRMLSLATGGVERAAHYTAGFVGPMIASLTAPLLVLAVMAIAIDAAVAGWLGLLLLVVPLLIGGFQRAVSPVGKVYRETQGRLTSKFLEALQAVETLVYARAAERVRDDLAEVGEEYRRSLMRMLARNQLLILVTDAAFTLTIVISATAMTISRVSSGALTIGEGTAILLMTVLVTGPVDVIGRFFYIGIGGRAAVRQISAHLARTPVERSAQRTGVELGGGSAPVERSAQRGVETISHHGFDSASGSAQPAVRDGVDSAPGSAQPAVRDGFDSAQAGLVLDRVTGGWPGGPDVVRGFSMIVRPGERVALVGPSGVGKSTISALIQAHLRPRDGVVSVDGLDIRSADPAEVRSRLAMVEQRTFLFTGTIAENLRIARPDAPDDDLWEALDLAGLRREVEAMPEGLRTEVGEHGTLLSGGQAQRLAIARAALRDAPILVLDEPTSQVDLAGEAAILAALDRLAEGRTVLMIAHRPGAILSADRTVELPA